MTRIRRTIMKDGLAVLKHRFGPYESDHAEEGRPLTIELRPLHLVVRLKGTRLALPISYRALYTVACQARARELARERAEARKRKRLERRQGVGR